MATAAEILLALGACALPVALRGTPGGATGEADTVVVKGRLILPGGGASLAGAVVTIRTGIHEIDAPESVTALGGPGAVRGIQWPELDWRVRAAGGWRYAYRAEAACDGTFSIPISSDLPAFQFHVDADFATCSDPRLFLPGSPEVREGVVLPLDPAGKIEAMFRGSRAEPVPGAAVALWGKNFGRVAFGDEEGRVSIGGVPPGEYRFLHASGRGFGAGETQRVVVRAFEVATVELVLPTEAWLSGRVVDEEDRPVAGARVDVEPATGRTPIGSIYRFYDRAVTGPGGDFRLGSLPEADLWVRADATGWIPSLPQAIRCEAGKGVEGIRLVLSRGASLRGRVLEADGRPVPGASIWVQFPMEDFFRARGPFSRLGSQTCWSGEDGTFEIGGLEEAKGYRLLCARGHRSPRRLLYADAELSGRQAGGEEAKFILPKPATLRGIVRDAGTKTPLRSFGVVWEWAAGGTEPSLSEGEAFASLDGTFEIEGMQARGYRFTFAAQGYLPEVRDDVKVKPGDTLGPWEVNLRRGERIWGSVRDSKSGTPVVGALVEALDSPSKQGKLWRLPWRPCRTDGEGNFELTGVEPFGARLRVSHPDFAEETTGTVGFADDDRAKGIAVRLRAKRE